jgi:predicted O-methyltransferase YrrM
MPVQEQPMAKYFSYAKSLIKKIPGLPRSVQGALEYYENPFLRFAAPGHFYSPIPDLGFIQKHSKTIFAREKTSCPGIELRVQAQIDLIRNLASYYDEMPFADKKQKDYRYYFKNEFFGPGCSIILYSLMRHFRPRRILEIGSGFSSAAMLDVNDHFLEGSVIFTFVEPYPERLYSLLNEEDRQKHHIYVDIAQHVPQNVFTELEKNDILFIDSSHVAKVGSDVVFLLSEILPILPTGVLIHIHDICWPFEYPEDWILSGRAWNEAYLVKAFLQFNHSFEILLFNSYLGFHHQDLMKQCLPFFCWTREAAYGFEEPPKA